MASETIAPAAAARPWTRLPGWLRGLTALGVAAAAVAGLTLGLARSRAPLTVEVDGRPLRFQTHAATVGAALHQAGLELVSEDLVWPGPDVPLAAGMVVQVQRARPATLVVDGQARQLYSHATTAGGLLAEAGVRAGPGDEIWIDGRLVDAEAPLLSPGYDARQVSHRGGLRLPARPALPEVALRRAAAVILDDDGLQTTLHTTLATVGQVLQARGLVLYLGDRVTPGLEEPIVPSMTVTVERSVPVQLEVDGRTIHTRTRAETVAEALGQEGIALMGRDAVAPAESAAIRPNLAIRVHRVREELAVEFEPIPYEAVWVADPEVEIDTTRLVQEGQIGLTKRRYRLRYEDGQPVSRELEDAWTEQAPVTRTMAYGTKIVVRTLDTPDGPIEYWRKMRVYTTSYTAASAGRPKTHPRYGYTRLGWKLTKGVVAVDPEVIPLKTRLYIPGYGFARAGDTGGAVKGKFVDLGFDSYNYQSWHWWTEVYLLTPAPPRSDVRWVLPNWPRYPDKRRR